MTIIIIIIIIIPRLCRWLYKLEPLFNLKLFCLLLFRSWLAHHFGEENVAQFADQLETAGSNNKTICHQFETLPQLLSPPAVDCNAIDLMSLF